MIVFTSFKLNIFQVVLAGAAEKDLSISVTSAEHSTTKTQRNTMDHKATLGVCTTNTLGLLQSVRPNFQLIVDVPYGGVLLALPALISCGLLPAVEYISNDHGVITAYKTFFS